MITVTEVGPGKFQFAGLWPQGAGVKVHLKLTDVNGDVDERDVEWAAADSMPFAKAVLEVGKLVDQEPFWDASAFGGFFSATPTNSDNVGEVTLELLQP